MQTGGEIPSPRVGHASALVSNVLIVWGGDTKDPGSTEKQDDGLYLLNLGKVSFKAFMCICSFAFFKYHASGPAYQFTDQAL